MRRRDFGRDIEAKAKPLKAWSDDSARKRTEYVVQDDLRNNLAGVGDAEFEHPTFRPRKNYDGLVWCAIGYGVAEQI